MLRIAIAGMGSPAHEPMKACLTQKDRCQDVAPADMIPGKAGLRHINQSVRSDQINLHMQRNAPEKSKTASNCRATMD